MKPVTKITFVDETKLKFFGEGPCRLLRGVEQTGSLRASAMEMGMAYSKATKLIRQAEEALGFPLTTRAAGGKDGGGSVLTEEGRQWLSRYEAYRDACIKANEALYRQYFPETSCVIMASGLGKRFGSNKLTAPFLGKPMILRALDVTEGLFDRRVVVTRHEAVADLCRELGVEAVLHGLPHRSDTIRLGLEAVGDVDCCLFCPGDQPLLQRETVNALLSRWRQEPDRIHRPAFGETAGSPVLFPRWAFPQLKTLPEGRGGSWLLKQYPDRISTLPVSSQWELQDADTPEMLRQLEREAIL